MNLVALRVLPKLLGKAVRSLGGRRLQLFGEFAPFVLQSRSTVPFPRLEDSPFRSLLSASAPFSSDEQAKLYRLRDQLGKLKMYLCSK